MTTGGLPTFDALLDKAPVPGQFKKTLKKTIGWGAPGIREGGNLIGELFPGPEKIVPPPTPAPSPTPTLIDDEALQKERARRRQRINASGRGGTILTGGSVLGNSSMTGSSLLGG